jgi:hypothetical protein
MGSLLNRINFTVKTLIAVWEVLSVDRGGRQKRNGGGFVRKRIGQIIKQGKEGFVRKQNLMSKSSYGNIKLSNTKCHVFL